MMKFRTYTPSATVHWVRATRNPQSSPFKFCKCITRGRGSCSATRLPWETARSAK